MTDSLDATIQITDSVISEIYYQEESKIIDSIPNKIRSRKDLLKLKIDKRDKTLAANLLYETIKKNLLLEIDKNIEKTVKNFDYFQKKIVESLTEEYSKKNVKKTIKTVKETTETVKPLLIYYDKFNWFKDPNLLSTIRFHERLNEIFLKRAEGSLKFTYNEEQINNTLKEFKIHPEYLKAILVVTLFPVFAYGAIYASTRDEYDFILKYENLVSETAQILFSRSPELKSDFFEQLST